MGQAKLRRDTSPDISVLVPTRGRPENLARLLKSLGRHASVEVIIGLDADDPYVPDYVAKIAEIAPDYPLIIVAQRHPTLGALINSLAAKSSGAWMAAVPDDYVLMTPDWPEKLLADCAQLPRRMGVVYLNDSLHPEFTAFPVISRFAYNAIGHYLNDSFPYWFGDTWWDEIGEMMGTKVESQVQVFAPAGKGKTHGLVDFPFWLEYFEATRRLRVEQAMLLAKSAFDPQDERMKRMLAELPQRQAHCAQRVAHLHNPKLQEAFGSLQDAKPSEAYAAVKAKAEAYLEKFRKDHPKHIRVALCIPSGREWEAGTALDVCALAAFSAMHGLELVPINLQTSMISNGRNGTVEIALTNKCDYLFWIDSDMRFPPDALMRLLSHQKEVVGAIYNKRVPPFETLGLLKGEKPAKIHDGLHEALLLPGGMLLVHASVYRKIRWPAYFETYRWEIGQDGLHGFKAMMRDYFRDVPSEDVLASLDGTAFGEWVKDNYGLGEHGEAFIMFSEDLNFCRKIRKAGVEIWCDMGLTQQVKHIGIAEIPCRDPSTLTQVERQQLVAAGFDVNRYEVQEAAE